MLRLKGTRLAPYMQLATALIGKTREGGGNMFRLQLDSMAILIDYGYIDSVLLKAAIIHDILEDIPDYNRNLILSVDYESHVVYELVQEVTRLPEESKPEFLKRIHREGSLNAKILKIADRISNMISLGFVNNPEFVGRYTDETELYLLPIAKEVNEFMHKELESLVNSRRQNLTHLFQFKTDEKTVDSTDFI